VIYSSEIYIAHYKICSGTFRVTRRYGPPHIKVGIVVRLILIFMAFKLCFILYKVTLGYYGIKFYFGTDVDVRLVYLLPQSSYEAVQYLLSWEVYGWQFCFIWFCQGISIS
jgi:hypothetical protein